MVGLPPGLASQPLVQALNRRLIQAYPQRHARSSSCRSRSATGGRRHCWPLLVVSGSLLIGLGGFAIGAYIPFFVLNSKRAKRQRLMAEQLPEALDFLSRVLKAGHSFSTGLQMMADELPAPLSHEIRRCYDQHSLGQSLDDSLKDTALRIESTDFAFFVTAVLIQRQTGGDLSEVLKNISGMIRNRVRLAQQVKAKTAEGRFTGYILVAFPAVMFGLCYVQNPDLLRQAAARHRPVLPGDRLRPADARALFHQEDHDDQGVGILIARGSVVTLSRLRRQPIAMDH